VVLTIPGGGTLSAAVTVEAVDAGGGSATSATDYNAFGTQTVTFPIGAADGATQSVTLNVLADTDVEGNETVNLQLQNVSAPATIGAQNTHVATITDDDIPTWKAMRPSTCSCKTCPRPPPLAHKTPMSPPSPMMMPARLLNSNAPVTAIWKPTAAIFLSLWSMEIWPLPKVLR
jgi:hypothetical protein